MLIGVAPAHRGCQFAFAWSASVFSWFVCCRITFFTQGYLHECNKVSSPRKESTIQYPPQGRTSQQWTNSVASARISWFAVLFCQLTFSRNASTACFIQTTALNRHVCLHSQICQALILRVCLCLLTLESTNFKSSRICNYELFNCNYFNKLLATAESLMSHCPWKMPATAVAYGCRGCMLHYILATDTDSVT